MTKYTMKTKQYHLMQKDDKFSTWFTLQSFQNKIDAEAMAQRIKNRAVMRYSEFPKVTIQFN